jgi:hypothetical protein
MTGEFRVSEGTEIWLPFDECNQRMTITYAPIAVSSSIVGIFFRNMSPSTGDVSRFVVLPCQVQEHISRSEAYVMFGNSFTCLLLYRWSTQIRDMRQNMLKCVTIVGL